MDIKTCLLLLFTLKLVVPSPVYAQSVEAVMEKTVANTHDGILIKAAPKISLTGKTITDDAFISGGKIEFDSVIHGDLIIVGVDISVLGIVNHDLRVVGSRVYINNSIGGNLTVIGKEVEFGPQAIVGNSVIIVADSVSVDGIMYGKGKLSANSVRFNGRYMHEWKAFAGKVEFGNRFENFRTFLYHSPSKAIQPHASEVVYHQNNTPMLMPFKDMFYDFAQPLYILFVVGKALEVVVLLAVGRSLMYVFPKHTENILKSIHDGFIPRAGEPLLISRGIFISYFLRGISILTVMVIMIIGLAVTFVGLPLALTLTSFMLTLSLVSFLLMTLLWGSIICLKCKYGKRRGWALALGLGIYLLVGFIPYFAMLYMLINICIGLGVITAFAVKNRETMLPV